MSEKLTDDMERDARLTALYRAAADEQPAPALDDAIRAAARRAVASKPRLAGAPFSRTWQVPLSLAAVIVLSVSLVTLMREEAPEIAEPPSAEQPLHSMPSAPGTTEQAPTAPRALADGKNTSGLGLRPPSSSPSSGLGLRRESESGASAKLRKESATADRLEPAPPAPPPAKSTAPEAFPGAAAVRDNKMAAPAEQSRQSSADDARRDRAATVEPQRPSVIAGIPAESKAPVKAEADAGGLASRLTRGPEAPAAAKPAPPANAPTEDKMQVKRDAGSSQGYLEQAPQPRIQSQPEQPPPAAKPAPRPMAKPAAPAYAPESLKEKQAISMAQAVQAYANLPPEQWLARIEELRKQGRLEEARANLTEFRKRYPNYELPASLKDSFPP